MLQAHWVALFAGALVVPVVAHQRAPGLFAWSVALALATAAAAVASAWLWRRGSDAAALAPLVGAFAVTVLIGYGAVAPAENRLHGHRDLAAALDRVLPPGETTVMFFHELDEGLWFYLRGRELAPVPGSQPEYNDAFRLLEDLRNNRFEWDPGKRMEAQQRTLVSWLSHPVGPGPRSPYVLLREDRYDRFAPALRGVAEPVYRERGLKRNALVLLRALPPGSDSGPVASARADDRAGRRE